MASCEDGVGKPLSEQDIDGNRFVCLKSETQHVCNFSKSIHLIFFPVDTLNFPFCFKGSTDKWGDKGPLSLSLAALALSLIVNACCINYMRKLKTKREEGKKSLEC